MLSFFVRGPHCEGTPPIILKSPHAVIHPAHMGNTRKRPATRNNTQSTHATCRGRGGGVLLATCRRGASLGDHHGVPVLRHDGKQRLSNGSVLGSPGILRVGKREAGLCTQNKGLSRAKNGNFFVTGIDAAVSVMPKRTRRHANVLFLRNAPTADSSGCALPGGGRSSWFELRGRDGSAAEHAPSAVSRRSNALYLTETKKLSKPMPLEEGSGEKHTDRSPWLTKICTTKFMRYPEGCMGVRLYYCCNKGRVGNKLIVEEGANPTFSGRDPRRGENVRVSCMCTHHTGVGMQRGSRTAVLL